VKHTVPASEIDGSQRQVHLKAMNLSLPHTDTAARSAPEWRVRPGLLPYPEALAFMEERANAIAAGRANELVWLVEHPPIYTAGTSASPADLIDARFPVFNTGRGGQFTYHGPGQRVAYLMLDLKRRKPDVRAFVRDLEEWLIRTLASVGVTGERRPDRVGIWVVQPGGREEKIAAIGVRVRRWVTFHGIALNVAPDLSHFSGIVPCGVREHGVTSLAALGIDASMSGVDAALKSAFVGVFGPVES
jgi:lipoyl(octanoyl) transferase